MMDSLPGYDAWKTTPPEPEPMVCPKCGVLSEDIGELEIDGMERYGFMRYPLIIPKYATHDDAEPMGFSIAGQLNPAREHAYFVTVYRCECGWIGVENGLVSAREFYEP
jgi:hypothetical protein